MIEEEPEKGEVGGSGGENSDENYSNSPEIREIISQYTPASSGPFVEICKCPIYERLKMEEELRIKEATTGYLDAQTGQEIGNFVTYVIEIGVIKGQKAIDGYFILNQIFIRRSVDGGTAILNCWRLI